MARNLELIALAASVAGIRGALEPTLNKAIGTLRTMDEHANLLNEEIGDNTLFATFKESADDAIRAGINPEQYRNVASVVFGEAGIEVNTVRSYVKMAQDGIIFHHATPPDVNGNPITWERLKNTTSVREYRQLVRDGRSDDLDREIARVKGILGKYLTNLAKGIRPSDMGKTNPPRCDADDSLRMLKEMAERLGVDVAPKAKAEDDETDGAGGGNGRDNRAVDRPDGRARSIN